MTNIPLPPMTNAEIHEAKREAVEWINYFRGTKPPYRSPIGSIYLLVRYIIHLEEEGTPAIWSLRELITGTLLGFIIGTIIFIG